MYPFNRRPAVYGHIDRLESRQVSGWAWNRRRPDVAQNLDVFVKNIFVGQVRAAIDRPDLRKAGIGTGRYGFSLHIPLDIQEPFLADVHITPALAPDIRLTAEPAGTAPPRATATLSRIAAHFGILLDHLLSLTDVELTDSHSIEQPPHLPASRATEPISAFAKHLALKHGFAGQLPVCSQREAALLTWYLTDYASAKYPDKVPLSAAELDHLRAPAEVGARPSRGERLLGREAAAGDEIAAAYAWAIEDSARWLVEDCLVDEPTGDFLRAPQTAGDARPFPLSRFMAIFAAQNALTASLPTSTSEQRQRLYHVIMLYALRAPHLLLYMPGAWLQAMLAADNGASPFERISREAFPDGPQINAAFYHRHMARSGFDVATQSWPASPRGGPRLPRKTVPPRSTRVDVQIIGPFRRTLGLGESCRRLAALVAAAGLTMHFVDYDLGNASAAHPCPFPLAPPARARINVLHLNLEEIPEAVTFLPDVFSGAHNIAFPYWELDRPAACHALGLDLIDEIWAASSFIAGVFRPHVKVTSEIGMMVDPEPFARAPAACRTDLARYGIGDTDFVFLATSDALSGVFRKNVGGVIAAFTAAFPDDASVRLIIKTHNVGAVTSRAEKGVWDAVLAHCAADRRIVLIDETLDAAAQRALRRACDVLVSLHRAEGLGLDILDALHEGMAVVATDYSGSNDACTPETAWPVACDIVAVPPGHYPFAEPAHRWAEPRLTAAVEALRQVRTQAAERARRTAAARTHVGARFGRDAVGARIADRLAAILDAMPGG